jgi:hypothetical protein
VANTSPYQTFQNLYEAVIKDAKDNTAISAVVDLVKRYLNEGYEIVNVRAKREYLDKTFAVSLEEKSDLTVSVTEGSSIIVNVGTAVLPTTTLERGITIQGLAEIYQVDSISSNNIYISTTFKGETSTSSGAVLFQRSILLDESIKEVKQVYHNYYDGPLRNLGPQRWNVSALASPQLFTYASEFAIFGRDATNTDERRMLIYPYPDKAYTLYIDAQIHYTQLVNPSDEPLIPIECRQVLYFYALAKYWQYQRNDTKTAENMSMFKTWLDLLNGLNETSQDYSQLIVDYERPRRRWSYRAFDPRMRDTPDDT